MPSIAALLEPANDAGELGSEREDQAQKQDRSGVGAHPPIDGVRIRCILK